MGHRGVRLLGRELNSPKWRRQRMCDDETLVTDGPFAETKELMGGFDLRRRPRRGD
jgi:hypothetical protein